jgi:hypothetical protein
MNPIPLGLAAVWLVAASSAQKIALTDGTERVVAVLDVGALLPEQRGVALPPPAPAGRFARTEPTSLARLADFVRAFAVPLAGPGADLQPLGERHLVAMGSPVQVAAAERLVAHVGKQLDAEFQIDVRLCNVPAAAFALHAAPLLAKAAAPDADPAVANPSAVIDADTAHRLLRALRTGGADIIQFPQIVSPSLRSARLMVGEQLSYVRDFEIEVTDGTFVADPIVDVVFDGHDVEVMCAETSPGLLGVQMRLVDQAVEQPIPTVRTTVPGSTREVSVQVPRIHGCRGSQTAEMSNGATAIMAARKNDGSWLVTLLTPRKIRSAPAELPRRR